MDNNKIIHILRNPYGYSQDELKMARLTAADILDASAAPHPAPAPMAAGADKRSPATPPPATSGNLSAVINDHCADLRRAATELDAHKHMPATANELRKAADELEQALTTPPNTQGGPE